MVRMMGSSRAARRATGLVATLAWVALLAPTASASPATSTGPRGQVIADHVEVFAVLDGRLDDVMGNQHRLMLQTDRSSASWPGSNARILSYYCTAGARVTMSWTSSRCISRGTSYLRYDDGDYRVSPTMRTAVVDGTMEAGRARIAFDLTLVAQGSRTSTRDDQGRIRRVWPARAWGRVDDAAIRPDAPGKRNAMIVRVERG
ncbi:hypothetical protein [Janibacter alkaliphilus]|uniref:Uncharacterized protein n=1 Tax=Janibacter alkaliphilus TaxID=1069963 RepID=A0A852X0Z7_9MICO|nr:hypothetical protein [Janibacter alkaliphilus]NYG36992.1 hypothetical protein [Janibacter alkaliphilus]